MNRKAGKSGKARDPSFPFFPTFQFKSDLTLQSPA